MADTIVFSSFRRPSLVNDARRGSPDRSTPALAEPQSALPPPAPPEPVALQPEPVGPDAAELLDVPLFYDQLGLNHPGCVTLLAQLPDSAPVALSAEISGLYRPPSFRPAPWSGFAYDQATNKLAGLLAGTRILTEHGEVEVERLMLGDAAMALRGPALLPVVWIGRSLPAEAIVTIDAEAFGPGIPRRSLRVGPDQAVYLKPTPVAAKTLVNDSTVRLVEHPEPELFHVDLGRAEVIFAEGLALSSTTRADPRA